MRKQCYSKRYANYIHQNINEEIPTAKLIKVSTRIQGDSRQRPIRSIMKTETGIGLQFGII